MVAASAELKQVCGIIMPISGIDDDHTEEHWSKVLAILEEAVAAAAMTARPVWQGFSNDVIQGRILQNLYESDFAICDLSTRNPNVMLELGMRLTTKKPTLLIAEVGTKLPFDTAIIHTEFYDPKLEYASTRKFIKLLAERLIEIKSSVEEQTYHSFVESFRFETIEPKTVKVTATEVLDHKLDELLKHIRKQDRSSVLTLSPQNVIVETVQRGSAPLTEEEVARVLNRPPVNPEEWAVGARVAHSKFGVGNITAVQGNRISVDFDSAGSRLVTNAFLTILKN